LCGVSVPQFVLVVCMIGIGLLMVSEVKYPDFKGKSEIYINKFSIVLTAIFVVACLVYDWHTWAVMIFAGYVMFGLINGALNIVRK
ncbi:MAG: CDP-diacylglycerol--serine O-phosphatidyltransferase, partial [Veillonella sp.]|nr:CDP-diacylglycerol--serine O-phosphatidyltransferase [Veillonella sp.]MDU3757396.1 CDP-diacylglycerol--serine O-phosphatidyltransferase [Veillonella sp.]